MNIIMLQGNAGKIAKNVWGSDYMNVNTKEIQISSLAYAYIYN